MSHPTPSPTPPRPPQALAPAEQALLGALLQQPHRLTEAGPLRPEHFYDPIHAALFHAVRAISATAPARQATADEANAPHEPGRPAGSWPASGRHDPRREQALEQLNAIVSLAARQAAGTTVVYAHQLIDACPEPRHVAAYGRMVLAAHTRRTVRAHAERLSRTAGDTTLPNRLQATAHAARTLTQHLDQLAHLWRPHPAATPRTPPPPAPRSHNERERSERHGDERAFLAAVTTHPTALDVIRTYLNPDDIDYPLHQDLARCLIALRHRGDAIDPVTVLWEAEHRGLLTTHQIAAQHVLDLCATSSEDPEHLARRLLDHAVLDQTVHTAHTIAAYSDNLTLSPHQLITGSRHALSQLAARHARRQHAQRSTSPARPPEPGPVPAVPPAPGPPEQAPSRPVAR
ncbi:DnaB-like helicase N-terminal domain-containing protein [Streptomyces sp. NPDC050095]|uniref:DnaB-like helicase N-terminal domain-containing protein n=1 Tax=unclassified Streptomyces TaxID=2593676 RepID=UPI0034173303